MHTSMDNFSLPYDSSRAGKNLLTESEQIDIPNDQFGDDEAGNQTG